MPVRVGVIIGRGRTERWMARRGGGSVRLPDNRRRMAIPLPAARGLIGRNDLHVCGKGHVAKVGRRARRQRRQNVAAGHSQWIHPILA